MIPRKIHQLWIDPTGGDRPLPPDVSAQTSVWSTMHPGFAHRVWSMRALLDELPAEDRDALSSALSLCRFESMQADLARLFLLYHCGGFWSDLKLCPLTGVLQNYTGEDLLLSEHFVSSYIPDPTGVLVNGFFGCSIRNPFIGACLAGALANVRARLSSTVWAVTGPKVFMDTRARIRRDTGADVRGLILPSHAVWDRLIGIRSISVEADRPHWSVREQAETMYLDSNAYADAVPVWRDAYLK